MIDFSPTRVSINRSICIGLCALGLLLFTGQAHAQDVPYTMDGPNFVDEGGTTVRGVINQSAYYSSNPLLLTTQSKSLWGSITSPELIAIDKTPQSSVASDTIVSSNNFNQSSFDSNDVHSKLNMTDQVQNWSMGVLGNIDYDTTRSSEFSAYNNIRSFPVRHQGEEITPQIGYNFSAADKLNMAGNYSESQYADAVFTNYNSYSLTPSYSHSFDERNTGLVSFQAQRYTALEGPTNITDTAGPSVGWQTILTPQLSGSASVGVQDTRQKTNTDPNPSWETNFNFNGNLLFKGDQDLINAGATRSEYPFGNGVEALLTQFTFSETHAINPLFSIGILGSYQLANYQGDETGSLKDLITGSGNLTYHATEYLDIIATYQYQHENLIGVSSDAQSNMGLLSIAYRPKPWTL